MLGQEGRSSSFTNSVPEKLGLVLSDDVAEVAQLSAKVNASLIDGFRSQSSFREKDLNYAVFHDSQDGVQHVWGPLLKQVNVVALILDSMRECAPSL